MIQECIYSFVYLGSICVYGAMLIWVIREATKKR